MCSSQEQPMLGSSNCWIYLANVLPARHRNTSSALELELRNVHLILKEMTFHMTTGECLAFRYSHSRSTKRAEIYRVRLPTHKGQDLPQLCIQNKPATVRAD